MSKKNPNDAWRVLWGFGLEETDEHSRKNYLDGLLKFKQILDIMFILVINQERDLCLFTFSHLFTSSVGPPLTSALLLSVFSVIGEKKPLGCLLYITTTLTGFPIISTLFANQPVILNVYSTELNKKILT